MLEAERARVVCVAVTWAGLCWALRGGRWAGVCRDEEVRRMFGAGSGWRGAKERGPARRGAVPRCWLALGGGQEGVCGQPERTVTGRGSAGQGCGASGARSDRMRRGGRRLAVAARGAKANARCAAATPHQAEYPARRETRSADRRGAVRGWARGSALVGAALGDTRHCAPPVLGRGSDGRAEGRCERAAPPGCKGRLITGRGV